MKNFYFIFACFYLFIGCSAKDMPIRDVSNAKMALVKADNEVVKKYEEKMLENIKLKYKTLQKLINEERYEEVEYLAQEIQADIRAMQTRAALKLTQDKLKIKKGELNIVNHEFTHIQEGE